MSLVLSFLMFAMLAMSIGALVVHLQRSVREFRAGYSEAEQRLTA